MNIVNLYPGSFGSNCYLLEADGHALVVDPSAAASAILRRVDADGCTLDGVLLTHGHFDHVMSVDTLREAVPGLPVYIHRGDAPMLTDGDKNGFSFFFGKERVWHAADILLSDGDTVPLGSASLTVLHTPGHSPGSVCYYAPADKLLLTGDTIFAEGVGRWDLWGGDLATLRASITSLGGLDGTLTIHPGHGDSATLARALQFASYYL